MSDEFPGLGRAQADGDDRRAGSLPPFVYNLSFVAIAMLVGALAVFSA